MQNKYCEQLVTSKIFNILRDINNILQIVIFPAKHENKCLLLISHKICLRKRLFSCHRQILRIHVNNIHFINFECKIVNFTEHLLAGELPRSLFFVPRWKQNYVVGGFEHSKYLTSSGFSKNSEAKASEFLENPEEMFLHYWTLF